MITPRPVSRSQVAALIRAVLGVAAVRMYRSSTALRGDRWSAPIRPTKAHGRALVEAYRAEGGVL